jgi:glycosyltransferase involved in cell wall biosynthesis
VLSKIFLASNLPEANQIKIRRNTCKQPGKLRIVLAARISPMKNTLTAVRMVCKMSGSVELDLWGLLEDKDYWEECLSQIALCPHDININYRGDVEHEKLHALLHEYDVMLLPTLGENFGHSIIEALDAGLPVVISDRTPWRSWNWLVLGLTYRLKTKLLFCERLLSTRQ